MYPDVRDSCVEDKISAAALSVLDALNSTGGDIIGECVHDAVQTVIPQECSDAVCDFIETYIDNCIFDDMEGDEV